MTARVLGPGDGQAGLLGSIGVRFLLDGDETGGGCASSTSHAAAGGAAPLHRHSREDEYSFVLEGRVGALLGDEVVHGEVGDLIFKPRGQWHTFWNDGSQHARILELISPAGFERYFEEVVELLRQPGPPRRARSPGSPRGTASNSTARASRGSRSSTTSTSGHRRNRSDRALLRAVGSGQLDGLEEHRLERPVAGVPLDLRDRVRYVLPGGDAAEDGVLAVEPGTRLRGDDEELRAVRVRPCVRHREEAARDRMVVELVLERSPAHCRRRAGSHPGS